MPWDLDACEARGLIGTIHFLNLHCIDEVREQRLRTRPSWRQSSHDAFIEEHRKFAHWLLDNATTAYDPPMPIIDTSNSSLTRVESRFIEHVRGYCPMGIEGPARQAKTRTDMRFIIGMKRISITVRVSPIFPAR